MRLIGIKESVGEVVQFGVGHGCHVFALVTTTIAVIPGERSERSEDKRGKGTQKPRMLMGPLPSRDWRHARRG